MNTAQLKIEKIIANKLFIYGLLLFFILIRCYHLDQDAPSMMISAICEEDEAYYTIEGINEYNIDNNRFLKGFEHNLVAPIVFYSKTITYLSLKIFGNNFWGLRMPVVLLSFIITLLLLNIFKKINKKYIALNYLMIFLLLSDFSFYIFSRYQNPQIYSILCITVILWLIVTYNFQSFFSILIIGFVCGFSVLSVYVYNVFLPMGIGSYILYLSFKEKNIKYLIYFSIGCLLSMLFFYITLIANNCPISQIFTVLSTHGGGIAKHQSLSFWQGLSNYFKLFFNAFSQIILTNFFRHNLITLYLFIALLPVSFIFGKKNKIISVLMLLLSIQLLQLLFINSVSYKKMIILLPIIYIIILFSFTQIIEKKDSIFKQSKALFLASNCIALFCCLYNFKLNNAALYWSGYSSIYKYYENVPMLLVVINLTLVLIAFIFFMIILFKEINFYNLLIHFLIFPIAFQIVMCSYFFMYKSTYFSRNALIAMKPIIENKVVIGGFPHFYQFYTNCIPAMSCYTEFNYYGEKRYNQIIDSLYRYQVSEYTIVKNIKNEPLNVPKNFNLIGFYPLKYFDEYLLKRKKCN